MIGELKRGLVQIYTGDGKGKTTAAFGQALRAYGRGLKVRIIQFLKDGNSGEVMVVKKMIPGIEVSSFGRPGIISQTGLTAEDRNLALEGLNRAKQLIRDGDQDILILDEICVAVWLGLIPENEVLGLIKEKPEYMELIFTGRYATKKIIDAADLVTEMREKKHPYNKTGMKAREGREY